MNKVTLYLGLNDKDSKKQEVSTIEAFKIASKIITSYTDGGTIFEADGIYRHDNGDIVIEKTLKIELVDITSTAVNSIISALKISLNQESILKQTEVINSEFC